MATAIVKPKLVQIDDLVIDCSLSETHSFDSEITDNPVERSADVSDHKRLKPETLTISGLVSNTPLGDAANESDAAKRGARAFDRLLELRAKSELFKVVTSKRTYEDMAIASLTIPVDGKQGDGLQFSIGFKKIKVVDSKTVKTTATNKGKGKKKKDKQTKEQVKQPDKEGSQLSKLDDATGETGEKASDFINSLIPGG